MYLGSTTMTINKKGDPMNTHQRKLIAAASLCAALTVPGIASAAGISGQGTWETTLQARDLDGNFTTVEAYYDTALNVTWLANANAAANTAYDILSPGSGLMNWTTAKAWAANLNVDGVTGWSLPTMSDPGATCVDSSSGTTCGWNSDPASGELAHLFFTTLGDTSYYDASHNVQPFYGLTNTGPFSNIQSSSYWYATVYAPDTSRTWDFSANVGQQGITYNSDGYSMYAWAVHPGDVGTAIATVPLPAAFWLFGSGLLGLIGTARRKAV